MKRIIIVLGLAISLCLTLSSCFLTDLIVDFLTSTQTEHPHETNGKETDNDRPPSETQLSIPIDNDAEKELIDMGFEKVEKAETGERTIEELLQALRDGEPMTDASGAEYASIPQTFSVDITEMTQLQGTTVQFSEEPWVTDKTVEEFNIEDFTSEMTSEEKAEWDEMMSMTEEDWAAQIAEMEAEMEEMVNSFDDMDTGEYGENPEDLEDLEIPSAEDIQKQLEDALEGLPDEYKDLFGGLGDLGGLLGGLLG